MYLPRVLGDYSFFQVASGRVQQQDRLDPRVRCHPLAQNEISIAPAVLFYAPKP